MGLARVRIWSEEKNKTKLTDDVVSLKNKKKKRKNNKKKELPADPVVRTPCFHCQRFHCSIPDLQTQMLQAA